MMTAPRGARRSTPSGRPWRTAWVLSATLLAVCAGCAAPGPSPAVDSAPVTAAQASSSPSPTRDAVQPAPAATAVDPVRVVIPALGLDEPLIPLGLATDGAMEVPVDFDEVGWFTGGGRPGGTGPTVIAAHVDSPTGPAVFQRLDEVAVGDLVEVHDVDGTLHTYRVTETADYPKADFPTARVFGATAADTLRVITCGGVFDRDAGSYLDNRVVFAERV